MIVFLRAIDHQELLLSICEGVIDNEVPREM